MQWVSVQDRLPLDGQLVLALGKTEISNEVDIYLAKFFTTVNYISYEGLNSVLNNQWVEQSFGYDMDVAYWMEFPEPPKEI